MRYSHSREVERARELPAGNRFSEPLVSVAYICCRYQSCAAYSYVVTDACVLLLLLLLLLAATLQSATRGLERRRVWHDIAQTTAGPCGRAHAER